MAKLKTITYHHYINVIMNSQNSIMSGWLFPGHGSQYPGMGRGFFDISPLIKRIFTDAEAVSAQPLREISIQGDRTALCNCEVLEPMLTAFSLSYIELLRSKGARPHCVAGYSAGETAALFCSGVISAEHALQIATMRGRILQAASADLQGKMVAIFDINADLVRRMVSDLAHQGILEVAGNNAPDHLTIVGETGLVEQLEYLARQQGGSIFPLDVSGLWHCTLAKHAAQQVHQQLQHFPFHPPTMAVYTSASGNLEYHPERLRQNLADSIYKPVLWQASILNMHQEQGISHFIEVGIGRTLKGITRRISGTSQSSPFHFFNPFYQEPEFAHDL